MTKQDKAWRVLASKGCGSAILEAALVAAGVRYDREELDYTTPAGRDQLLAHNPLAQVPTVIMPDGGVMTETAALVLHLDELAPQARLLPPVGDPARREALRWLVFLVAAVYPTFTYGDDPSKWGSSEALTRAALEHRKRLWQYLDGVARGPWFLGEQRSALDLYVSVMTRWQPGRPWFAEATPRLAQIAAAIDRDPKLAPVWAANF